MLRTKVDDQQTLWEAIPPPQFSCLPPGLEQVDRLLDDPVFFEPFKPFFDPTIGRPSIPMETYLRMMFLRFRYRLGFETLCAEVADSIAWRRFCRIGIADPVPHPTTLMKITTRCGHQAINQLNEALLNKAMAAHIVKLDKVRADTTVVPANVAYPTDSGLLAKGVAKLTKTVAALHALGLARRTGFRDRTRSVRRRAHQIAAGLRRRSGDAKDEVLGLTGELATIAEAAIKDAQVVATNARRGIRRAIPRKGRPGAQRQTLESSRRFRKLVKWRTGSEGRISHLKRSWGWERTMLDGINGASTWCGWGVLAHNATKISTLIEERETSQASAGAKQIGRPTATGPPGRPPPPTKSRAA